MVLVLVGTQNNSFHRLLEEVEKNIEDKTIDEEICVNRDEGRSTEWPGEILL